MSSKLPTSYKHPLLRKKGFILDVDGVICRGKNKIDEGVKGVKKLIDMGKKIVFVSNNSARSREMLLERFNDFGLDVDVDSIMVTTYATSRYLRKNYGKMRVFTTGEEGLMCELESFGHKIVEYTDADCLVVASNRNLSYDLMTKALRCCLSKKLYVATNPDRIFPGWDGPIPGTGMIVGALYWMTGRMPDIIVGKPSEVIMREALEKLNLPPEEVAVIGDQIEVDVVAGKKVGCETAVVLTGVTNEENINVMIEKYGKPDYILKSVNSLFTSNK